MALAVLRERALQNKDFNGTLRYVDEAIAVMDMRTSTGPNYQALRLSRALIRFELGEVEEGLNIARTVFERPFRQNDLAEQRLHQEAGKVYSILLERAHRYAEVADIRGQLD